MYVDIILIKPSYKILDMDKKGVYPLILGHELEKLEP